MSTTAAYGIGRFLGRYWIPTLAIVLGVPALGIIAKGGHQMEDNYAKLAAKTAASKDPTEALKADCAAKREINIAEAASAAKKGDFGLAHLKVSGCAELTQDKELVSVASNYFFLDRKRVLLAKDSTPAERVAAGNDIMNSYKEEAKLLAPQIKAANDAVKRAERAEQLAIAKKKRSEGVTIGMSREDVLASSWGKPQSVNRTQYKWGVHEQWVYGGGNYLYFKDGILETIQN